MEVHDELELDRALTAGADIIGVNNRNLKTFQVDLSVTERLAARLGAKAQARQHSIGAGALHAKVLVAESGLHTRADVERLARCGAKAILVGESLMKQADIAAKVKELLA